MPPALAPRTTSDASASASLSYALKGAAVFNKLSSQRLRQMAEELGTIGEQEPELGAEKAVLFAKSLSILMRCELARRASHGRD